MKGVTQKGTNAQGRRKGKDDIREMLSENSQEQMKEGREKKKKQERKESKGRRKT